MSSETVVIVGAGPGGLVCAIKLAQLGISSIVLEKESFPRDKICGDALSGKVVNVMQKIMPDFVPTFSQQTTQVPCWGIHFFAPNQSSLRIPFKLSYNSQKDTPVGFIAKRIYFDHFLADYARKHPNIQLIENATVQKLNRTQTGIQISLADGRTLQTNLVVGADGAQSQVAKQLADFQIDAKHFCAGLRVYYTGIQNLEQDNFIELHFLNEVLPGYFWIFPLPNGEANVGLGMRSDVVQKQKINLKKLLQQIITENPTFQKRFQAAKALEPIRGFGLPMASRRRVLSGDNFLLVGDAASLIDPFTGEGVGNAMISGYIAAEKTYAAIQQQKFDSKFLKQYDKAVFQQLDSELKVSTILQKLLNYPALFNFVVRKANNNPALKETIICMFENVDLRSKLKNPLFYLKLLFS